MFRSLERLRPHRLLPIHSHRGCYAPSDGLRRRPGPAIASNGNASVVLVAGATGGIGQEVVDQALAQGYSVRALVRDEAKARMLFGDRVQYVVGDVREPRSLRRAVKGADQVISALGANVQRDPGEQP